MNADGRRPLSEALRSLPSVDRLMSDERVQRLVESGSREAVVDLVRAEVAQSREAAKGGESPPGLDELVAAIVDRAASEWRSRPVPVINATGVILHTNLGRAPLSEGAMEAVRRAAGGYSDLELDLETGRRGSRQSHLSRLVCRLTGAEAAMAVNNNASAVMLGLAVVAAGRQVIVSRGEAVEIGGGFRIPDVLRQSGADLVEVGTTNRDLRPRLRSGHHRLDGRYTRGPRQQLQGVGLHPLARPLGAGGGGPQTRRPGAPRPGQRLPSGHDEVRAGPRTYYPRRASPRVHRWPS